MDSRPNRPCRLQPGRRGRKVGAPVGEQEKRGTSPRATLPVPTPHNLAYSEMVATQKRTVYPGLESGTLFSYRSHVPAVAGTRRYENWCSRASPSWIPAPYRGTGPALRRNHHGLAKAALEDEKWTRDSVDCMSASLNPSPLDSGLRRSDVWERLLAGIGVESRCRSLFSYQSLIPACAGTPRYENECAGWQVFYTVARD